MENPSSLYQPLDARKKEIRLLQLALNDGHDEIICRLLTTTVEAAPPYEALSYTWGSANDRVPILVNGQALEVTRNLHQALVTLRRKYTRRNGELHTTTGFTRTLWIDAICINQDSLSERSSQVRLMWTIYNRAEEVVVYLGDEEEDGMIGMEMARLLDLHFEVENKKMIDAIQRILDGQDSEIDMESSSDDAQAAGGRNPIDAIGDLNLADDSGEPSQSPGLSPIAAIAESNEMEGGSRDATNDTALSHPTNSASADEKPPSGNMNMFMMTKRPIITVAPGRLPRLEDGDQEFEAAPGPNPLQVVDRPDLQHDNLEPMGPVAPEDQSKIPFYMLLAMHGNSWDGAGEDPAEWLAFQKLLERPWWRRVWVIQEVAAASGQVWVACGQHWLRWETFLGAAHTIDKYKNHPFFQQLNRFGDGAKWIHDKSLLKARKDGRLDSWGGLLNIIYQTRAYEATDPRDKIFALLGFTPSIGIIPDYEQTPEQIFESLVRKSIQDTGCLMLPFCGRKPKRLPLPSWVPDFSLSLPPDAYNMNCPMGFFGADGNNWQNVGVPTAMCTLDDDDKPGELRIRGFSYDKPLVLGPTWQAESKDRQWKFFKIIEQYTKLLDETDKIHFPELHKTFYRNECFWRTLIWNANAADRYPAPANFGAYLSELLASNEALVNMSLPAHRVREDERIIPAGKASAYYEAFVSQGLNRRFFITEKGHLGSGPPEMQLGDVICVAFGFKTPVILRELEEDSKYELVGHAYVHGIMHGEALGSVDLEAKTGMLDAP
ncbi:Heterokaryon incompatibility protein (HET) domain containing protein [Naviculisporaceae sp. PSN 640]